MMHDQHHLSTAIRTSNPRSVLNAIGAGQGTSIARRQPEVAEVAEPPRLRILSMDEKDSDSEELGGGTENVHGDLDVLQSTIESAKQIQQLAMRLSAAREQLDSREQDFELKSKSWQESIEKQELEFERRSQKLQQQSAHVRLQQRHVMQLQDDIVKSHESSKAALEAIVERGFNGEVDRDLIRAMKTLQHELEGRFDYIAKRWEHLYRSLEDQRVQLGYAQSVDDRVRWS